MDSGLVVIFVLAAILGYIIYEAYFQGEVEYIVAKDGNKYLVQSLPDKQQAADLLSDIRKNLEKLVQHLEKMYPSDERTQRLVLNFKAEKISEGKDNAKYTSYSVNKGERIVFCLRSRDENNKLMDLNTMMFVALHELAHVCTVSTGHTPEFWANFKWLLEEAVNIGVYTEQDFKSKPVPYCGIQITDSPLN